MTGDSSHDQARNLAELRAIAHRLGLADAAPAERAGRLRAHPEAPTFLARLRRSGLSDAAVAAALFDATERSGPPTDP
jgi:hypothetical protein